MPRARISRMESALHKPADEDVCERLGDGPLRQLLCAADRDEHRLPGNATQVRRLWHHAGENGRQQPIEATIDNALPACMQVPESLKRTTADTSEQAKPIANQADSLLCLLRGVRPLSTAPRAARTEAGRDRWAVVAMLERGQAAIGTAASARRGHSRRVRKDSAGPTKWRQTHIDPWRFKDLWDARAFPLKASLSDAADPRQKQARRRKPGSW